MVQMWRMCVTFSSLIAISWYLISTEEDGEETHMDLVLDFTALIIIIEIDNMVHPIRNIKFDELNVHRNESLRRKFLRYKQFQKQGHLFDGLFKAFMQIINIMKLFYLILFIVFFSNPFISSGHNYTI